MELTIVANIPHQILILFQQVLKALVNLAIIVQNLLIISIIRLGSRGILLFWVPRRLTFIMHVVQDLHLCINTGVVSLGLWDIVELLELVEIHFVKLCIPFQNYFVLLMNGKIGTAHTIGGFVVEL